ncbi:MAG: hypothetical protein KJI72_04290 [Patescibacteria group bacterium]|nr:hypothetical protein [Patescibacteria group bacterium]
MTRKKPSKKQKRKIRKQQKANYSKHRKHRANEKQTPWAPVKMKMFELPDPFPDDLSQSKRKEIFKKYVKDAKECFDMKYPLLERWFEEYDPLYLLSFCAVYFLSCPEGIDREALGEQEFFCHYLEILQAFALINERCDSAQPLLEKQNQFMDEMKEIGDTMQVRLFDMVGEIEEDTDIHKQELRFSMMAATTAVRNWAYFYQMERVATDLARLVRDRFFNKYGLESDKIIRMLFQLCSLVEDKLNTHLNKTKTFFKKKTLPEIIASYNIAFPENVPIKGKDLDTMWELANKDIKKLKLMLICHSDLKLQDIYTFTLNDIADAYGDRTKTKKLQYLLDKWSFCFGDLKNQNKEYIIMDNPVHHKPFIKTDDSVYFSSAIGMLPHISISLLEEIIFEDAVWKKEYTDELKSKYLEKEVERLCMKYFPTASIFRGSCWGNPNDDKAYENDLCVVLDNFAIIIESKSGLMSPAARRGAPKSLKENLTKLVIEPALQANRFIDFLKSNKRLHKFSTIRGVVNEIDSSLIDYYIPLSITLEQMGGIVSNLKNLIDAGMVDKKINELAPSMCLTDFEIVMDTLSLEASRVHYLSRRREFEYNVNYTGDEISLLAFYLDNGFNIGDTEFKKGISMNISLKSKELDPYFIAKGDGKILEKPKLAMTKWWEDMLGYINKRKKRNWVTNSYILLSTTIDQQKEFELRFKGLKKLIKRGKAPHRHTWIIFLSGCKKRSHLIIGFPYNTTDKELRNDLMAESLSPDNDVGEVLGALCIGQNIDTADYPYSVLGGRNENKLFID